MSVWNECNKKTCVDFIAGNYHHVFSMPKKERESIFYFFIYKLVFEMNAIKRRV